MLFKDQKTVLSSLAVLGAGVSGKAVMQWAAEQGISAVLYDRSGAEGTQADFTPANAARHDAVVYSPGFPPEHPWLAIARAAQLPCLTEADFAAGIRPDAFANAVAVTGTNGKTTLTEFLAFAHRLSGRHAAAVGNNGIPVTTLLLNAAPKTDFPVCEISSFQAECMQCLAPASVLWTNFDEDHLDRHGSSENYFRAKFRLVERQIAARPDGVCVIGESVAEAARRFKIRFPESTQIATREEVRDKIPEGSIFNSFPQSENYAIARRYWLACGYPIEELEAAAKQFAPKAHRLARCAVIETANVQIEFWNDSKGTNFHAVYAALATFPQRPVYWIGGGLGKGGDLGAFCRRIAPGIRSAALIGETAPELSAHLTDHGTPARVFGTLAEAVHASFEAALTAKAPRAVVLFSPGFASFDMFKSYADRGRTFEALVETLKQKK